MDTFDNLLDFKLNKKNATKYFVIDIFDHKGCVFELLIYEYHMI